MLFRLAVLLRQALKGNLRASNQFVMICNNLLTVKLLQMQKNAVPLHPVISFSVINYVVSMRRPRVSGEVSFLFYQYLEREKLNINPPSGLLDTLILPLWNATAFLTIDNPNPDPPSSLVRPSDSL